MRKAATRRKASKAKGNANTSIAELNQSVSTYGKVQMRLLCDEAWLNLTPTHAKPATRLNAGNGLFGDSTHSFNISTYEAHPRPKKTDRDAAKLFLSSSDDEFKVSVSKKYRCSANSTRAPANHKAPKQHLRKTKKSAAGRRKVGKANKENAKNPTGKGIDNKDATNTNKEKIIRKEGENKEKEVLAPSNVPNALQQPNGASRAGEVCNESADMFSSFCHHEGTGKEHLPQMASKLGNILDSSVCTQGRTVSITPQEALTQEKGIIHVDASPQKAVCLKNDSHLALSNISMASSHHISLNSTVMQHAVNIDMIEGVKGVELGSSTHLALPSACTGVRHQAVAQSTPLGNMPGPLCTRSFFRNVTSKAITLSGTFENASMDRNDGNATNKEGDVPTDFGATKKQGATETSILAPDSISFAKTDADIAQPKKVTNEPPQEKAATVVAKPRKPKRAKKAPRPKTKKAPIWKKCPGSTIRKKAKKGEQNDSILHQIMTGLLKPNMLAFDDSADIYHVNSSSEIGPAVGIKLPCSTALPTDTATKGTSPHNEEPKISHKTLSKTNQKRKNRTKQRRSSKMRKYESDQPSGDSNSCDVEISNRASLKPVKHISTVVPNNVEDEAVIIPDKNGSTKQVAVDNTNDQISSQSSAANDKFAVQVEVAECMTHKEQLPQTRNLVKNTTHATHHTNCRKSILIDYSQESNSSLGLMMTSTNSICTSGGDSSQWCPSDAGSTQVDLHSQPGDIKRPRRMNLRKRAAVNYKHLSMGVVCPQKVRKTCIESILEETSITRPSSNEKDCATSCHEGRVNFDRSSPTVKPADSAEMQSSRSHVDKLNCLAGRSRRDRRGRPPVPVYDESSLFSSLSFAEENKATSVYVPMHAFSTINKSDDQNTHGGLLSDDENVNMENCAGKRVSTPIVSYSPSKSLVQLYDHSPCPASAAEQSDTAVVEHTPAAAVQQSMEKEVSGCSPIEQTTPAMHLSTSSSSSASTPSSPPAGDAHPPEKIFHPRIASLKNQRTTSTPNSAKIQNLTPAEILCKQTDPSLSRPLCMYPPTFMTPPTMNLSCGSRHNGRSLISSRKSFRKCCRSPGSRHSPSVILFAEDSDDSMSFANGRKRRTLDPQFKKQMLSSITVDLSSVISSEDGVLCEQSKIQRTTPQTGNRVRYSMPCPDLKVLVTPMRNSFLSKLDTKDGRFRLKSLGFVNALTPKRARDEDGRILTAKQKVLYECDQTEPIPFEQASAGLRTDTCIKLGEGLYGEVFRCHCYDRPEPIAIKVIPIEGKLIVNNEKQKTFEEMLPEIVSSKELHALRDLPYNRTEGFIELYKITCARGTYPSFLVDSWDRYDEERRSDNDRPDKFGDDQLYLIFQFADGGADVEHFKFRSSIQAFSVMQQVCAALAVAEQALQFEHRDLHWGNVLVTHTKSTSVPFTLNNKSFDIQTHGVKASIIDFTLSRLSKGGVTVFQDLASDPELFSMSSDEDYQFEIYRLMRKATKNQWSRFQPKTNIFWMHYLNDKLHKEVVFSHKKAKTHRTNLTMLRNLKNDILNHDSCSAMILFSDILSIKDGS